MTNPAPTPASDSSWQAHEQEARLLAELLRTSRLALLFDESGSTKTALLNEGLMPLLHRRTTDRPARAGTRESGVVVPFPDRRSRGSARGNRRRREVVVYFDGWAGTPLLALQGAIHQAAMGPGDRAAPAARLADTLAGLSNRLDASFIILLDRFEDFLRAPPDDEAIAGFADELVEAINQPDLPANFLIALNGEASPRLASLRRRIPGFDDFSLRLAGPKGSRIPAEPTPEADAPAPPVPAAARSEPVRETGNRVASEAPSASTRQPARAPKVKRPPPPRVQIRTEDVYALIESTLTRTATGRAVNPAAVRDALHTEQRAVFGRDAGPAGVPAYHARPAPVPPGPPRADAPAPGAALPSPTNGGRPDKADVDAAETQPGAFEWVRRRLRLKPTRSS